MKYVHRYDGIVTWGIVIWERAMAYFIPNRAFEDPQSNILPKGCKILAFGSSMMEPFGAYGWSMQPFFGSLQGYMLLYVFFLYM